MVTKNSFKALGEALIPKTPERAAFLAASAALVVAGAKRSKKVEKVAKPLVMLSLQAGLWRTRHQRGAVDNALLGVATTASLAGDVLMMEEEFATGQTLKDMWLKRGASAFAVNHVAMIALAHRRGARRNRTEMLLRAGGVLEGFAVLAVKRPHLLLPLGAYSKMLAWMSVMMASPKLIPEGADDCDPRHGLELGGLSFLASDAMLLHRGTFMKDEQLRAAAEVFVLTTYTIAQVLLVDGLAES